MCGPLGVVQQERLRHHPAVLDSVLRLLAASQLQYVFQVANKPLKICWEEWGRCQPQNPPTWQIC